MNDESDAFVTTILKEHSDLDNWRFRLFYFNKQDPRIIVPKLNKARGWTLNWARPAALPFLLFAITFTLSPLYYSPRAFASTNLTLEFILAHVIVVVLICTYAASAKRIKRK